MLLKKGGVTVELSHPSDIARYKRIGYEEVVIGRPLETINQEQKDSQEEDTAPEINDQSEEKLPETEPENK